MHPPGTNSLRAPIRLIAAVAVILNVGAVFGQQGETDAGEVSAYGGLGFGSVGTHVAVAGSTGFTLNRYSMVLIEAAYLPLGSNTLVHRQGHVARNSGLYDFNLAAHIRMPVRSRWEPYGLFGPALLYNRYHTQSNQPDGSVTWVAGQSDVKFGFGLGAGLRYYLGGAWGVRSEYRYTISNQNFSRLVCGVFYQFSPSVEAP